MTSQPETVKQMEDKSAGSVVTVTGGCGFLGQHLIKLMHSHTTNISSVRVLDCLPFKQELDYSPVVEVNSVVGSVTSMDDVLTATKNATTVFHLACVTDLHMFPDKHLAKLVNVQGTSNVIRACRENGVKNLIQVSDVAVVMGHKSIVRGTEDSTRYPWTHLSYDGRTKCMAEKLVLDANGAELGQGRGQLRTLALRPVTLFGERDPYLLPTFLRLAASNCGHVLCVGSLKTRSHLMYVGNAAWALLCAHDALLLKDPNNSGGKPSPGLVTPVDVDVTSEQDKALPTKGDGQPLPQATQSQSLTDSRSVWLEQLPIADVTEGESDPDVGGVEGKAYFVCDDTPTINLFLFMQPILSRYGFFLTSWSLPQRWAKLAMKVVEWLLWLLYPFVPVNPPMSSSHVDQLCRTYTFNDALARHQLKYAPIFTRAEGVQRTVRFYDDKYKEALSEDLLEHALQSKHVGMLMRMPKIRQDITAMDLGDTGKRFRAKPQVDKSPGWLPFRKQQQLSITQR